VCFWLALNKNVAAVTEKIQRDRSVIVVAEATKSCENSHEQKEVSEWINSAGDVGASWFSVEDAIERESKKERSMHDVTEHDCEQEGERDAGKDGGVCFLVVWHAISIHNLLEDPTELGFSEICGSGQLMVNDTIAHDAV
jgi:hypothetical protein